MKEIYNVLVAVTSLVLIFLLAFAGCQKGTSEDESPISEEEKESVEVRPEVLFSIADERPIYQFIESQGVVEAGQSIKLKPRISGYVEQSIIREGQKVTKGDTLLTLDRREYQIAVEEALSSYKEALQKYNLEMKMRNQNDTNTVAANDNGKNLVRITTGLAQAEQELKRARLNLSYTVLTAPFSGVLSTEERIDPGSYVSSGNPIGQLVNTRSVRIRFDILESEYARVDEGMKVELTTPGGNRSSGVVEAVDPVVDTESKTGTVVVRAPNKDGLLVPGMTVEGRIRVSEQNGKVRVPRSAILSRDGGRTLLFKLNSENNEVEWVYVEPVAQNNEWAIINHPDITPGDTIAVDRHFALSHLQIVEPRIQLTQ